MILRKWNNEKHVYEPYEVPDSWRIVLYTEDMDLIINCPHCGNEIRYGESYTSLEIHNPVGFGYPVCGDCYIKEWERRRKANYE